MSIFRIPWETPADYLSLVESLVGYYNRLNNVTNSDDHVTDITSSPDRDRAQKEIRTKPPMKC